MAGTLYKWLIIALLGSIIPINENTYARGLISAAEDHPIFISVIEVDHNSTDKTLEISCKIFTDDFEKVLTQKYGTAIHIYNVKDRADLEKRMALYVRERLAFKVDGKLASYSYLGYEQEEDYLYCYLQADNVNTVKKLEILNSMLHDLNNNQVNIMHVSVGGKRQSYKLDWPENRVEFVF